MAQKFSVGGSKNPTRESKAGCKDRKLEEYERMAEMEYEMDRNEEKGRKDRFTGADNRLKVKLEKMRNPLMDAEVGSAMKIA